MPTVSRTSGGLDYRKRVAMTRFFGACVPTKWLVPWKFPKRLLTFALTRMVLFHPGDSITQSLPTFLAQWKSANRQIQLSRLGYGSVESKILAHLTSNVPKCESFRPLRHLTWLTKLCREIGWRSGGVADGATVDGEIEPCRHSD
jgi:hypothetical protein